MSDNPLKLSRMRLPVIAAPMFLVSGLDLVVSACRAGLIGAFPAANARDAEGLSEWFRRITEGLADCPDAGAFAVNINVHPARYADQSSIIAACRSARVPLVITSVGDPTEVVKAVHEWGGYVFHDVTTIRHAEKAIQAGVDGLILVCAGAGGHAGGASAFSLLPRVRQFFSGAIVLAGGIATGGGVLAARALGADLVYMGTRFIASAESLASHEYKKMILDSDLKDVVYTDGISGLPANFLRPSIMKGGMDPANLLPPLRVGKGQLPPGVKAWRDVWSAGHAVALIESAPPVHEIVQMLSQEYETAKNALRSAL